MTEATRASSMMRSIVRPMLFAALVVTTIVMLATYSRWRFDAHLRDDAARSLALSARGTTPWSWQFRSPRDIVAGRAFDAARFDFADGALRVESSGRAFEIGLPLPHPVDVRRFPTLHIDATPSLDAQISGVVGREHASTLLGTPSTLSAEAHSLRIDLPSADDPGALPATMLRLRVQMPAGGRLTLRDVRLARIAGYQPLRVDVPLVVTRFDPDARLPPHAALRATPLVALPARARSEVQHVWLDRIRAAIPAAIVIPVGAEAAVRAQAHESLDSVPAQSQPALRIGLATLFACALLLIRVRPPRAPRQRALLETLAALSGPLWLIAGEHFDGMPDFTQCIVIASTVAFAASLARTSTWRWNGSRSTWLISSLVVLAACAVGFACHDAAQGMRWPDAGHVTRYLAWAIAQQYLVCVVATSRWQVATGSRVAATYLGALGFAMLHAPNGALMLATFIGGLCWCTLFLRDRALLPLAASHAASAMVLIALAAPQWLYSAEVSARFFR